MSSDSAFENAFGGNSTPAAQPEPVAPAAPQTPTPATPEPAAAAPLAPQPAAAEPAKPHEVIPFATSLQWRDDAKNYKRKFEELEARSAQPHQQIPSVQDEEAYTAHVSDLVNRAVVSERFNVSEYQAQEKHGVEAVKSAMDWGMQRSQESPAFAAEYMRQKHPIDWAVRQHKRDRLVNEIGENDEAYVRRRYAELNPTAAPIPAPQAPAAQAAPQPAPPVTPLPTRSLATATSAGGVQVNPVPGEAEAFKATFSR